MIVNGRWTFVKDHKAIQRKGIGGKRRVFLWGAHDGTSDHTTKNHMKRTRPKQDRLKWQVVLKDVGFGLVIEKSFALIPKMFRNCPCLHGAGGLFENLHSDTRTLCVHFSHLDSYTWAAIDKACTYEWTTTRHVLHSSWNMFSKNKHYSRINNKYNWKDLCDYLKRKNFLYFRMGN